MKLAAIGVVAAISMLLPAQDLPDWVLQLSRIKRHARGNFEHFPNYACKQTVERFVMTAKDPVFRHTDTLELEVAVVGGHEFFARAGGEFDLRSPNQIVGMGMFGTGAFSSTARNLFVNDAGRTTAWAKETDGGRPVLRFDFEIPQTLRPLTLSNGGFQAIVGLRGSFWADAESLDLLEIEDHAVDIPLELQMTDVMQTIHYGHEKIGATDVILPRQAETLVTRFHGELSKNVSTFSACREFGSESKITFDEPAPPPVKKK
jgi:hypothetical protein